MPTTADTIVDLAVETADLSTLATAIEAADLVGTLLGKGPFTVFAPTNAAFDALPAGTLDSLLEPANKAQLVDVLTYHVLSGDVRAADITNKATVATLEGNDITTRLVGDNVFVNNAKVTTADVAATNGVVHIIDTVIMTDSPATADTIVDLAIATADLSTLTTAIQAADLVGTLLGKGPFTVFAPTNAAFDALPAGTLDNLLEPANKAQLVDVLTYHVLSGEVRAANITDGQTETTVEGNDVTFAVNGDVVEVNDAAVTTANVDATNGVVHIIDSVLLPPNDDDGDAATTAFQGFTAAMSVGMVTLAYVTA